MTKNEKMEDEILNLKERVKGRLLQIIGETPSKELFNRGCCNLYEIRYGNNLYQEEEFDEKELIFDREADELFDECSGKVYQGKMGFL